MFKFGRLKLAFGYYHGVYEYALQAMLSSHQDRIALGSRTEVVLVADAGPEAVADMFRSIWLAVFTFENRFSRFLPASELSRFNRAAGTRQPVSPEFHAVLTAAVAMAATCEGLYNPFILPALQRAGYMQSMVAAHKDDTVDDFSNRSVVPAGQLEIGETWARIPYGTALDLGGCGKGFLGDRLAELAGTFPNIYGYWFSLGGDIVAGGRAEDGNPWVIGIEHTAGPGPLAGHTVAAAGERYAVATSSVTQRKGVKAGRPWHHLIDPRTNQPAKTAHLTASVSAPSGLLADVLASCLLMLDTDEAIQFAEAKGAGGALLQHNDGSITAWGNIQRA